MATPLAPPEIQIDFSVLESYDFTVPCQYKAHMRAHVPEEPGKFYIQVSVQCGCVEKYVMCESGLNRLMAQPSLNCAEHGTSQLFNLKVLDRL